MKALILEDLDGTEIPGAVEESFRQAGWQTETLRPASMKISPCSGCFHCWVRTPGICIIPDEGRSVAEACMGADVVALITPVTFGGYSPAIKKMMDRLIPILSPFFMKISGELHHKPRYEKYPALIGIGLLEQKDDVEAALFSQIIGRNALNVHAPWHGAFVLSGGQEYKEAGDYIRSLAPLSKEAA
ncbi:MAG: NAD(P)H-dependent oxidoreductase [Nitrospiraceae bacterium]|nr:NAD(P)H-dependent oxidoreductase [Nitrospiraceae bacterium]